MSEMIKASLHQTDTACAWLVRHSRKGLCKLYPSIPPLRRSGHPVFWGSQSCVPTAWLAERLLLAGDIESNPGQNTGPLGVSRESGASASQVEETPGRAALK